MYNKASMKQDLDTLLSMCRDYLVSDNQNSVSSADKPKQDNTKQENNMMITPEEVERRLKDKSVKR